MRVQVNWVDDHNQIVDVSINVWDATMEWTQRELFATAPERASNAVIFANAHAGEVWLDDLSFTLQP